MKWGRCGQPGCWGRVWRKGCARTRRVTVVWFFPQRVYAGRLLQLHAPEANLQRAPAGAVRAPAQEVSVRVSALTLGSGWCVFFAPDDLQAKLGIRVISSLQGAAWNVAPV